MLNSTEFDAIIFAVPHKEFNQLDLTEWVSGNKVLLFDANNVLYIVLGDWNDDLRDKPGEHCFQPFLEDDRMYFANTPLLNDDSQVSYPKEPYRSFLDHILVTENLLNSNSNYRIMTIPIDQYMGGFEVYEEYISDHKPVMVGIPLN